MTATFMPGVIFLDGNKASSPFRKAFLGGMRAFARPVSVFLVVGDGDLGRLAEPINDRALLVLVRKGFIAIGPLHEPGKSACFSCLRHWILSSGLIRELPDSPPGKREAQVSIGLLEQAFSRDGHVGEDLHNAMLTFDLAQKKGAIHPIYPLRNCNACSAIEAPKHWGLRIHCSSLTGIVQKMEITKTPAAGAYRAIAEWASPLPVGKARRILKTQESHGRGRTREEAEEGCIGEALERYSLIYRGDEPLQRARLCDVTGVDPRDILLYSDSQYESREDWNRTTDERYFVGERFDPSRRIDWFPGWNLADGTPKLLPAACVLMWYSFPAGETEYARADSIGCGSGRTLDDALAHALLEWIERDAMAIWWYNRTRRPAVRLETFAMDELLNVREDLRRVGRDLILLDCTTDFGIPTYISVAPRVDGTEPLFAGASHFSPRIAAWKAASEVGQLWFTAVHRQSIDAELKDWLAESLETQVHLTPSHEIEAPAEPPMLNSGDLVRTIVDRLRAGGLDAYAADLSRVDVLLKTARTIVPGLRHIWNRRAPGRLYDVPVRLGWRNAPCQESQLNPVCCMI